MNQSNYPGLTPAAQNPWAGEVTGMEPYGQPDGAAYPPQPGTMVPSTVADPHLNMSHGQSDAVIQMPQNRDDVYMGSLKAMLSNNVGNHIVASFLMGSQNLVSWEGILYDVGNNYLTIYQEPKGRYVVGDLYALKFMEFYEPAPQSTLSPIPRPAPWTSPR